MRASSWTGPGSAEAPISEADLRRAVRLFTFEVYGVWIWIRRIMWRMVGPDGERANRICWYAWAATVAIAIVAPLLKHWTHGEVHGSVAIYSCVAVMVATYVVVRRDHRGIFLPIAMSASGLAVGAAAGFLLAPLFGSKPIAYLLGLMWALGGIFLTFLFLRLLRQAPPPEVEDFDSEDFKRRFEAMSDEEKKAEVGRIRAELNTTLDEVEALLAKRKRFFILGAVFCVIGISLLVVDNFFLKHHR
jgi:hypothetical protein